MTGSASQNTLCFRSRTLGHMKPDLAGTYNATLWTALIQTASRKQEPQLQSAQGAPHQGPLPTVLMLSGFSTSNIQALNRSMLRRV